ncbi:MAG: cytochrome c [Saprospiraceae bacterium]|nr:cytochrome c [Saprospiraceae bacterium]
MEVVEAETGVYDLLLELGTAPYDHAGSFTDKQRQMGEDIVRCGQTIGPDGKMSSYVSKYYVCTTCHNLDQEDPDLRISDPEARLPYVKSKGLPFLQGTTFRGIVNRESWYNDDYVRKYGEEKIGKAHNSLRGSIQLCAVECSQGRPMEVWEINAVLAYFWTLQWNVGDLDFSEADYQRVNRDIQNASKKAELKDWLKTFYLDKSPAHFFDAPPDKAVGYVGLKGNPDTGRDLYELSCLHCHKPEGVSHYVLDESKLSFRHLYDKIPRDTHFSLYQIIAYGTYAIPGHRPYMPHYPIERMSKQQVEDLRSYIELMAL